MARPRKPRDAHEVEENRKIIVRDLYAAGIPLKRIAEHMGIDEFTLLKHYKDQRDASRDAMNSALARNLDQDALNGSKQDREFWLKTRARWSYAKPAEDDKKALSDALLEKLIDKL